MRAFARLQRLAAGLLLVLPVLAKGVPAHAQTGRLQAVVHEVAWGENLYRIALRYGVSVDAIVAANGLPGPDYIYAGQQLVIPSAGAPSGPASPLTTHVVQPGENLFRIGLLYGLTVDALAQANGLDSSALLYAGQTLQIPGAGTPVQAAAAAPPPSVGTHTVAPGETLFGIARLYAVSVDALSAANGLYNPGQIYAGQTLIIPGGAGAGDVGYSPAQTAVTHVVAPGETLTSIAGRYGVAVSMLMQVNNIANPSLLYAGQTLTIPSSDALSPGAGGAAGKHIHVDLSEQRAYVYQDGQLLWTFVVSTGLPGSETWTGTYHVQNKLLNAYASTWNLQMPHWLGIYWAGSLQNGFHALPILPDGRRLWAGVLGRPVSYGCIVLGVEDAERLYNWAAVGTEVTIVP